MKTSVVIPAYNEEKYINTVLRHLANQIVPADEVIVVDNNSTDKTVQIAQKYQVKLIQEKKQGIVFARNAGFDAAKYDIIIRLDADTIPPKDYIKQVKANFKNSDIVAVTGKIKFYGLPPILPTFMIEFPFNRSAKYMLSHESLLGPNLAITKKVWKQVRDELCEDGEKMHEDMDLSIHVAENGNIKFDPKLVVLASSRRIKKDPYSFFVDYTVMAWRTLIKHKTKFIREMGILPE